MPLVIVANSPDKEAALAGLERWKARHPEAAQHLAVDDVLVDSMRGRSSTWTRIRVNLRNVPEAIRPPQETPDPDDDPTREWREAMKAVEAGADACYRPVAKMLASSSGGTTSSCCEGAVARLLVGPPAAELRRVAEPAALHVIVGDLDHELRPERLPRQILALAPAAGRARAALAGVRGGLLGLRPVLPRMIFERPLAVGREELDQLAPLLVREAPAHADVLQRVAVVEAEQKRADGGALAPLCQRKPATTQSHSRSCLTFSMTRLFGS